MMRVIGQFASTLEGPARSMARVFGEIPGVPKGATFRDRDELARAGVHPPTQAGISGSQADGADSIVISGGYEDDRDLGDTIIYTGHGGRDQATGKQIADQALDRGNLALVISADCGLPVRVTRGASAESESAPGQGYRYDGLYYVEDYWEERGASGHRVWRFRLQKNPDEPVTSPTPPPAGEPAGPAPRRAITIQRIVRSTAAAERVKARHEYHCQVCGDRLEVRGGRYAEAAHIRPLGSPHDGPDVEENILCLCPNHHVLFDRGGFTIAGDLALIGLEGRLRAKPGHPIGQEYLAYHREHYGRRLIEGPS
jgi:putative restriction endonuclease